jgi:hypothetical protein
MPASRLVDFDTWRGGYGLATVRVVKAGTTQLASIFADEELTDALPNPQTLAERILGGTSYGRWSQPVYCGEPYQLEIDSVDRTGVVRPPLVTLAGADASLALVTVDGGEEPIPLNEHLARRIDVRDFGEFLAVGEQDASAATNTTTLMAALGAAGARGGGYVEVPEGTYQIAIVTIPPGVVIRGAARDATILQSIEADNVVTIGGERAGLSRLTLDGISLVASSVGVYAEDKDHVVFDDVKIKRFALGLHQKGGQFGCWRLLTVSNCTNGVRIEGVDTDSLTAESSFHIWQGGQVDTCSGVGLLLRNDGQPCHHNIVSCVRFEGNTGKAVHIVGARHTALPNCSFENNTVDLEVEDGSPETDTNTVIGLFLDGGSIKDGDINLKGNLELVAFRRVDFQDVEVTLTTPGHNVLVEDCREISGVSLAGTTTAWQRHKTGDRGSSSGLTTGNAATKVWAITLEAGQRVYLEGKVIGRQRNGTNDGFFHIGVSARRPGASLAYDTQTANFTVGDVVTGQTSGATARITADSDGGTTGTLTLQDVQGEFLDDEIITDTSGGSATVNGALSYSNAALAGAVTALRAAQETNINWDATFVANGPQIELRVTGDTSQIVEWVADVDVVSS